MRLIVDMNTSTKWVEALRAVGFEALHWSSAGTDDASDYQIMEYAAEHDSIVVTRDLDFSAILAANRFQRPSVVHLSERDRSGSSLPCAILSVSCWPVRSFRWRQVGGA